MTGPRRTPDDYKAVAEFFKFISQPDIVAKWHIETGFVPITFTGVQMVQSQGYWQQNPGADISYRQLTRTRPTANTKGLRLGNMPEIRVVIYEEWEKAFQGQQTPSRRWTTPSVGATISCGGSRSRTSASNAETPDMQSTRPHPRVRWGWGRVRSSRSRSNERSAVFDNRVLPYVLLMPQLVVTVIFFFWPAGQAVYYSLLRQDPFGLRTSFVWFENFAHVFSEATYLSALGITVLFSRSVIALAMAFRRCCWRSPPIKAYAARDSTRLS